MGWNREKVQQRIKDRDFKSSEVEVTKHAKEMDFSNLGPKEVREVLGSHIYLDIRNIDSLVEEAGNDKDKQRKLIRALNTLLRAQNSLFPDQQIIQVQSARLHIINFKPYEDKANICKSSIVAALNYISFIHDVFNDVFHELTGLSCSAGSSHGKFFVGNIGKKGDRELISLGSSANWGAKILNGSGTLNITEESYLVLPADLKAIFSKEVFKDRVIYSSKILSWNEYPELKKNYACDYDPEALKSLIKDYKDSIALADIDITGTIQKLDFTLLSAKNTKRFHTVTLFCDLDGFTTYISEAEKNGTVKELVRLFHGVRCELQNVVEDFDGVPVQHRGDCLIATFNLPVDDEKKHKKIENVIQAAVGLLSSMEELNKYFKDYPNLNLAIGIDGGMTIATKLGTNGDKDKILIGNSVTKAENLQQDQTSGNEVVMTKHQYDLLEVQTLKKYFKVLPSGDFKAVGLATKLSDELKNSGKEQRRSAEVIENRVVVQTISNRDKAKPHVNSSAYYSGR